MKLWQKVFLWTLALVILAINITAILLLFNTHKSVIKKSELTALDTHEYVTENIKNTVVNERLKKGELFLSSYEVLRIAKDRIKNYDESDFGVSIYKEDKRVLEKNSLSEASERQVMNSITSTKDNFLAINPNGHSTYVLIGSEIVIEGKYYKLITTHDISNIYALFESQVKLVRSVGLIPAMITAGILLIIVRSLLYPLQKVNESTNEIARGHYEKRIEIKGNDEISQLAENMNSMAAAIENKVESLEQVAEDRRIFIGNLAHEMKTPLTSILGFADIMRIKKDISEDEIKEYSGIIVEEAKRLRGLSGKLMELITVGSTNVQFQQVTLKSLISEIEVVLQPIFKSNGLSLKTYIEDGVISVDKELFKSLIYNLIDNAVKASSQDRSIKLITHYDGGNAQIQIVDEGIGIPKDEIDKIINPFYMVDRSRSRKKGGAGLGLALCVEIARIHNSTLSIDSHVGKGTVITISMIGGGKIEK